MSAPNDDTLSLTIILTGFNRELSDEEAAELIGETFGINDETADRFVKNMPVVVKRGASKEVARVYVQTLHKIGAQVEVKRDEEVEEDEPPDARSAPKPPDSRSAPKPPDSSARSIGRISTVARARHRVSANIQTPGQPSTRPTRKTGEIDPVDIPETSLEPLPETPGDPFGDVPDHGWNPSVDLSDQPLDLAKAKKGDLFAYSSSVGVPTRKRPKEQSPKPPRRRPHRRLPQDPAPSGVANDFDMLIQHNIQADELPPQTGLPDAGITVDGAWPEEGNAFVINHNNAEEVARPSTFVPDSSGLDVSDVLGVAQPSLEDLLLVDNAASLDDLLKQQALDDAAEAAIEAEDEDEGPAAPPSPQSSDDWLSDEGGEGFIPQESHPSQALSNSDEPSFEPKPPPPRSSSSWKRKKGGAKPTSDEGSLDLNLDESASDSGFDDLPPIDHLPPEERRAPPLRLVTPTAPPKSSKAQAPQREPRPFWRSIPQATIAPLLGLGIVWQPLLALVMGLGLYLMATQGIVGLIAGVVILAIHTALMGSIFGLSATQALNGDLNAPKLAFERDELLKGGAVLALAAVLLFAGPAFLALSLPTPPTASEKTNQNLDKSESTDWTPEQTFYETPGGKAIRFKPNSPANIAFDKEGKRVLVDPSRRRVYLVGASGELLGKSKGPGFPLVHLILALLAIFVALTIWPMIMTIVALGERLSNALNPVYILKNIAAAGPRYHFTAGFGALTTTTAAGVLLGLLAAGTISLTEAPGIGALAALAFIASFTTSIQAQLIGVMIAETPKAFKDFHRGTIL